MTRRSFFALPWVVLAFPEETEVGEGCGSVADVCDLRRFKCSEFLAQHLPAEDVLVSPNVANRIETLQPFELAHDSRSLRFLALTGGSVDGFLQPVGSLPDEPRAAV